MAHRSHLGSGVWPWPKRDFMPFDNHGLSPLSPCHRKMLGAIINNDPRVTALINAEHHIWLLGVINGFINHQKDTLPFYIHRSSDARTYF